jgi:hypothetical protein
VVFWFHQNKGWRPKVLPPRSTSGRKGVFATRAPYRPNPIGLSALKLEKIEGLILHVSDVDMLDGTPVLDIKPYVPYTDAQPAARSGWLETTGVRPGGTGPSADPVRPYQVVFADEAAAQAAWIEVRTGIAMHARILNAPVDGAGAASLSTYPCRWTGFLPCHQGVAGPLSGGWA